ncbi:MAG: FmdB family transcriptional regulator [Actinomycetota bacterium]|nr:FmdB family transcriptional regulator [Actinomycetota bacterium]
MPTYEYACKSCGEHIEVAQSFRDDPLTTCATCGGPLRKVFGTIGIAFKGSGFYRTDSRDSGGGGAKQRDTKADAKSGDAKTGGDTKTGGDAKPAAKSDSSSSSKAAASS